MEYVFKYHLSSRCSAWGLSPISFASGLTRYIQDAKDGRQVTGVPPLQRLRHDRQAMAVPPLEGRELQGTGTGVCQVQD